MHKHIKLGPCSLAAKLSWQALILLHPSFFVSPAFPAAFRQRTCGGSTTRFLASVSRQTILHPGPASPKRCAHALCSNVLPMEVDIQRDFFTESSPSALRAIFSSWNLDGCKQWCAFPRQPSLP